MSNAIIEVDTKQFIGNLQSIKAHLQASSPNTKLCLPIKGNAYGHGIVAVAHLAEPFVDYIAVSSLLEAQSLKSAGLTKCPILIFGAFNAEDVPGMVQGRFEITIASQYKLEQVQDYCKKHHLKAKVHIKVDTGMHRVGVKPHSAYHIIDQLFASQELELVGIYSHLACADEEDRTFTKQQIAEFRAIVTYVKAINPQIICHLANSAGLCYYEDSYFDMVRPGILSYGYVPYITPNSKSLQAIKPCFSVKSKISFLKTLDKNQGVSYNHTYTTSQATYIATIPVGYGDGYRRILSNQGQVLINQQRYNVAGIICMDMFMVDLGPHPMVHVGDEVVLIGKQGKAEVSAYDLAAKCQTNIYEVMCGFNERIPRVYI